MRYEPVIGIEVHVELRTKTKMFCSCENGFGQEREPNVHICPVCTGQPGTLPVINQEAVKKVIQTALALNCNIPEFSKFDRKNYFYPDLPKGYQISQYDQPLSKNGYLEISVGNGYSEQNNFQFPISNFQTNSKSQVSNSKRIRITRIHLEEDTGKLVHPSGVDYSLADYNRAGVPLMELVTEPDIRSGLEAKKFCQELQLILRYLNVSDADMEKGQMRCEVNISIRPIDDGLRPEVLAVDGSPLPIDRPLGTKVEIKNLNSFKAVERGIDYEIKRQAEALESGGKIIQETRGWDDGKQMTISQRVKEEAHDYRYFPEPDLPPLNQLEVISEKLKVEMPELPNARRARFADEYKLPPSDIEILVTQKELGDFFECVVGELKEWAKFAEPKIDAARAVKLAANYLITELQKLFVQSGKNFADLKITAENFAEFVKLTAQGVVSSSGAQRVLAEMFATGADPSHVVEDKGLAQVSDEEELEKAVAEVISQNPGPVGEFRAGKAKALMFLIGKVMAATQGRANPQIVEEILKKRLSG